jgi:1,4-dihydroxy-2-naphthoate octaprenyltransferase
VSLPPGILTSLLLFLNEFPDAEVDKEGGRFHMVIWLGKKKAAFAYAAGLVLVYGIIVLLPVLKLTTWWMLVSLLTLPLALKAAVTAIKHGDDTPKLIPAMAMNVLVVLITDALMAVAIIVELILI